MKIVTNDERSRLNRIRMVQKLRNGRAFIIKTSVASEYLVKFREWITSGANGAIVYGAPRLGKTMGTRWVLKMLSKVLGYPIPHIWVPVRDESIATDRAFFQHLLHCAKSRDYAKGTAGDKRTRLANLLAARALRGVFSTIILVFDEAHELKTEHFKWLLNLGNELEKEGVALFCLFFGQRELIWTKYKLIQGGFSQIVNRYMVEVFEYRGIEGYAKFLECMTEFDRTCYPSGEASRWHLIFFADLGAHENPLVEAAPAAWARMEQIWRRGKLDEVTAIPMYSVCRYVTNLLNSCANKGGIRPTIEMIHQAVARSGLRETVAVQSQSESLPTSQATIEMIRAMLEESQDLGDGN